MGDDNDVELEPWVLNLENDLKSLPKINLMKGNSTVSKLKLHKTESDKLKDRLSTQLLHLWNQCHYSLKQRKAFEYLSKNLYDDGTGKNCLIFYDIEVNNLKKYYTNNKNIFALLDLYKIQVIQFKKLVSKSEKEEMYRKLMDTEDRLKKLGIQYRLLNNGKNFYTFGRTITEYIKDLSPSSNLILDSS